MAVSLPIDLQHRQPGGTRPGYIEPGKAARISGEKATADRGGATVVAVDPGPAHQLQRNHPALDHLQVVLVACCVKGRGPVGKRIAERSDESLIRG